MHGDALGKPERLKVVPGQLFLGLQYGLEAGDTRFEALECLAGMMTR